MPIVNYHVRDVAEQRVYSSHRIEDFKVLFQKRDYHFIYNLFNKPGRANVLYLNRYQFLVAPMDSWLPEMERYHQFPKPTMMAISDYIKTGKTHYYLYFYKKKEGTIIDRFIGLEHHFGLTARQVHARLNKRSGKNRYCISEDFFLCRAEEKDTFKHRIEIFSQVDRTRCTMSIFKLHDSHLKQDHHFGNLNQIYEFLLRRGVYYKSTNSMYSSSKRQKNVFGGRYKLTRVI